MEHLGVQNKLDGKLDFLYNFTMNQWGCNINVDFWEFSEFETVLTETTHERGSRSVADSKVDMPSHFPNFLKFYNYDAKKRLLGQINPGKAFYEQLTIIPQRIPSERSDGKLCTIDDHSGNDDDNDSDDDDDDDDTRTLFAQAARIHELENERKKFTT
jgi:hypothetical protein